MGKDNFKSRNASENNVVDLTPLLPDDFVPNPINVINELRAIAPLTVSERRRQHVSPVNRSRIEKR